MMQSAKYSGPDAAPLGSLSPNEVNLEPGGGCRRLQVLLCGLEAASILLAIMACPGIDRRAVEDDTIDACVNLIKNHIQKHVAPALSNTGHMGMLSPADDAKGDGDDGGIVGEEDDPPKIKRAKTVAPNRGAIAKSLKVVYTPILSTIGLFGTILERAEEFINVNEMDDRLLFTLSSAALLSLTIDASPIVRADVASLTSIVQESAMDLIAAIFARYPRHRSIIIEDLFPLMLKLPTSKRSHRSYLIKKRLGAASTSMSAGGSSAENDYIQPICVLTLMLIQASVVMPTQSGEEVAQEGDAKMDDRDASDDDDDDEEKPALDTTGLEGCDAVCNQFTSQMLLRCSRKGEEGGASEFRPILSNLIDDLLQVRFMIEFPAADMLLLNLSHRLGNDLMRASTASKSHVVEATYLATAMDAFGKITSHVAGRLRQSREDPLNLSDNMCDDEPMEEVNRCFCGRGNLDTFMVDCDRCHSWYHGSCVTITKDSVPDQWFCDDCKLQTAILDQAKVFGRSHDGSEALTSKDHNHVFRQVLLGYLSNIAQSSSSIPAEKTRQFLIASWVRDISRMQNSDGNGSFDIELVRTYVISQWSSPSQQQQSSYMNLTDHGLSKVMTALMASSQLSTSFGQLLGVLLKLMGDDMTALRKLSLKAFLQVATADPALMSNPSVRKEVSRCFHDPAISVREAAIGLVGDYVLQSPHLAAAFHSPLLERLADKGISVRKRVVKIFRDILLSNPSYGGRAMAMHFMLKRADDRKEDDGVRDLIYETFHTLWFSGKAFEMGKSSLFLSNDSKPEDSSKSVAIITKAQLYCREAAKQMVDVVKLSGNSEFLTSLVNGLLFGFNEGDKDKKAAERKLRQEDSRTQCNSLVLALVELLLSFEETRTHKEDDGKELVALLSVLSVYSQAYPELIVPHIDTLVPYLKGDNGVKKFEAAIVGTVSAIVSQSSSHFSSAELSRLTGGGLPADLVNIAYKVRICFSLSCIIRTPL
jgi:cohesin loading factor subunit SCC2